MGVLPRGWLEAIEARYQPYWPGDHTDGAYRDEQAEDLDDSSLDVLLTSAREQCEAYAPALPPGADVPERYRLAQSLQARALFRAGLTTGQSIGADGLVLPVFAMDWHVKALLRPPSGRPIIR